MKKLLIQGFSLLAMLVFLALPLFAAGSSEKVGKVEVTVGSKIDTEGALLGTMIVLLLEDGGFTVIDKTGTGTSPIVRSAILAGEIDIYPEYTGNGYYLFPDKSDIALWKDLQKGYAKVSELDLAANNIVWLEPSPANNTWAISIRSDLAESASLATLEDLATYINKGGKFKLAASEEFVSDEPALPSFEKGYGFKLRNDQLLVFAGGNTTLTEQAAASGQEGVNAAMAYGTDGQLAALGLKVLTDTKQIQPVYAPTPIIRGELLQKNPEIRTILDPVFKGLDLETLQRLNSSISVKGQSPRNVAQAYLKEKGFL
ncbi:MAG TPA: ABC transporter substrate-binding protein [Sphaerochaeta sp.]|nr:ABC transporter substrate-binding protein [Sphaerochaeta sp.]